ncbi:MAG: hypothetical protein PHI12_08590 [Dehalococcoidales bacterium]|nr:hypothetical protein [Dehalococcoidales bacterium]
MSLEIKSGGVTAISGLTIDADKGWAAKGISNIKEVVAGMAEGDMIYHDGTRIVKITPGVINSELITKGPTWPPIWGFVA